MGIGGHCIYFVLSSLSRNRMFNIDVNSRWNYAGVTARSISGHFQRQEICQFQI